MTLRTILIGFGAGLAAALLFAGVITGTPLALPLFLISPLPVAIAGLGFGTWSGAAAAAVAAALVGAVFGPISAVLHLVVFGAPVAWGAHLVGLARANETAEGGVEWFPLGMVLLRVALAIAAGVVVAGALLGFDPAVLVPQTVAAFQSWMQESGADAPSTEELTAIVRVSVGLTPVTTGMTALGIAVLNLWLGGHVTRMSGLLRRGWTVMRAVQLPTLAVLLLAIALALTALPSGAGYVAAAFAGALGFAFALTGYGAVHALLAGKPARLPLLVLLYAVSFFFLLPILAMVLIGIADTFLNFRNRRTVGASGPQS